VRARKCARAAVRRMRIMHTAAASPVMPFYVRAAPPVLSANLCFVPSANRQDVRRSREPGSKLWLHGRSGRELSTLAVPAFQ
jgi:hypothetical protein